MRALVFILIFSQLIWAQEEVFQTTIQNNSNQVVNDILNDEISEETMDLLLSTIDLQNQIDESLVEGPDCYEGKNPTDDKKKKKTVVKTKTVESLGYELVFLAEANSFKAPAAEDLSIRVEPTLAVKGLYNQMSNAQDEAEMYAILEQYIVSNGIRDLSVTEQAEFAAMISGMLPYSDPRAEFKQDYNQGSVSLFTQITSDNTDLTGICGDVHAAHNDIVKRINPDLEAYTMSYATDYSQHVISYVADPDDPDKIIMTNYSRVETKGTDGVTDLAPSNTGMDDVGERVRFFQYKNGKQDHVGTFRNDVGSLLYELATEDFEQSATPNDERYGVQQIKNSWSKVVNKYKTITKDGKTKVKHKSYQINNDIILFRGTTAYGSEMVGILHKRQKLMNVDENGELKPGETYGSHGYTATAVGNVSYDRNTPAFGGSNWYDEVDYFKVYFVTGKRYIKRIVEKNGFYFDGFIGHELEVGVTADVGPVSRYDMTKKFNFNTADGDYSTTAGFKLGKKFDNNQSIMFQTQLTNHIGLRDEPAIYSFTSSYPKNLKLTPNALNTRLSHKFHVPNVGDFQNTAEWTGTQMGGKFGYRFDFLPEGGGNVYFSFSTPTQGISSNKVNVLPENYTVMKFGVNSKDILQKNKKVDLFVRSRFEVAPTNVVPLTFQGGIQLRFGN